MRTFFSPTEYRRGSLAKVLVTIYLAPTALLILATTAEWVGTGGDLSGDFFWFFALVATLPLSACALAAYIAIETALGVPQADQDPGLWMLAAFAVCALVNAFLLWVVFRGRRIRAGEPEPA